MCDVHSTPTRGGKKYFVTFIDDFSRYYYVYLLHSKDEVVGIIHETSISYTPQQN